MLKIVVLSILLAGCGRPGFQANTYIDPNFQPMVDKFTEISGITPEVSIYFDDLTGDVIGTCYVRGEVRDIEIDEAWWWNASYLDRELVIFHELGHCVLDQMDHRDFKLSNGCSGSIMNTYHIGAYCYEKHYDYYIEELLYE